VGRRFQAELVILILKWYARRVLQKGVEKFPDDKELKKFLKDVEDDLDDPDGDMKPFLGLLLLALLHKKLRKK
jgi:hypothetical protein